MKTQTLKWLLVFAWLIWLVPREARDLLPGIFGNAVFPWVSTFISALVLSVGTFLSMHAFFSNPEQRRGAGWCCIGFAVLCFLAIGSLIAVNSMLPHVNQAGVELIENDIVPPLLQQLQKAKSLEEREWIAKAIYLFSGISVGYRADNDAHLVFVPTERDREEWLEFQGSSAKAMEALKILRRQIEESSWLIWIYLGSFFTTFIVGTLILMIRKDKPRNCGPNIP